MGWDERRIYHTVEQWKNGLVSDSSEVSKANNFSYLAIRSLHVRYFR